MKTIITNINIINFDKIIKNVDVLIDDNKIVKIDNNMILSDNNIVRGDNLYLFSAFVNCFKKCENSIKNQALNGVSTIIVVDNDIEYALKLKEFGYNVFYCFGAFGENDVLDENVLNIEYNNIKNNELVPVLFAKNSYLNDEGQFFELLNFSKKHGNIPILTYTNETLDEVGECDKKYGVTPIGLLEEYAILDNNHMLIGCENCDKEDATLLGEHDSFVCVTPTNSLRNGKGIAPIVALKNAGVNLCVGGENMLKELALIADLPAGVLNESGVLDESDVLKIASYNPNLLLNRLAGKVEVGQIADLVISDSPNLFDLNSSNIVYTFASGKIIYKRP